jgi:hypothetical protein
VLFITEQDQITYEEHLTQAASRPGCVMSLTLLYCLLDLIDSDCQPVINNGVETVPTNV